MKSDVSDLLELVTCIYQDVSAQCPADFSDLRPREARKAERAMRRAQQLDLETIRRRVKAEGVSFLTITLPDYSRDFENALESGRVHPSHFRSFRKCGAIPSLFSGMLVRIFDQETGVPYEEIDATLVRAIRQLCRTLSKVRIPCTPEREARAINRFKEVEHGFSEFSLSPAEIQEFTDISRVLWTNFGRSLDLSQLVPRHGPGQTAERVSGNRKYVWQRWHRRLEPLFPIVDYAYHPHCYEEGVDRDGCKEIREITLVSEDDESPVRVVLVPKTLKTPRIIAIEPVCMQYTQQALRSAFYEGIERYWLTRGHINFRDQTVNQQLAMNASSTGSLATLDMSDASDRVPYDLALLMFDECPDVQEALDVTRSRSARLPSGEVIPLRKYASMGSAMCFPIESLYFYTVTVLTLLKSRKLQITPRNAHCVSREVYVYGDDLIVPAHEAESVIEGLQKYNCKVNTHKSFWRGSFRESCGVDAFRGSQVTPVYLRTTLPYHRKQVKELVSTTASANLFQKAGLSRTATFLFGKVERVLGNLPWIDETSPALGRVSSVVSAQRWHPTLHRYEVKSFVVSPVRSSDKLTGYAALQKVFLEATNPEDPLPSSYEERLESFVLRGAVSLKRRWVAV